MTDKKNDYDAASDPQVNPYAPPTTAVARPAPRRPRGALRSPWVWCYAVGQLAATCAEVAYVTSLLPDANVYALVLRLGSALVGLAWLGSSYERVPPRLRVSYSPGTFIGRHFWPVYNLFWMFKAQSILCDALDTMLVENGRRRDAPRELATAGCALVLLSRFVSGLPGGVFTVFMLVPATVWTLYMIGVEGTFARAAEPPPRRICATCDYANEVDATFCNQCGTDVGPQKPHENYVQD